MEYAGADTFRHFQVMSNELSTPRILVCPADDRTVAVNFARLKNKTSVILLVWMQRKPAHKCC